MYIRKYNIILLPDLHNDPIVYNLVTIYVKYIFMKSAWFELAGRNSQFF